MKTMPSCSSPCGKHDVKGFVTTGTGKTLTLVGKRFHRSIEGTVFKGNDNKVGRFWILLSRPLGPDGLPMTRPEGCHGATVGCGIATTIAK